MSLLQSLGIIVSPGSLAPDQVELQITVKGLEALGALLPPPSGISSSGGSCVVDMHSLAMLLIYTVGMPGSDDEKLMASLG